MLVGRTPRGLAPGLAAHRLYQRSRHGAEHRCGDQDHEAAYCAEQESCRDHARGRADDTAEPDDADELRAEACMMTTDGRQRAVGRI